MNFTVRHAVVLGAGTMGGGIAALLASTGISVTLLDLPAEGPDRNSIVKALWERQRKSGALLFPDAAERVTLGNFEDHFEAVSRADWVIEAVVEDAASKRALLARVDAARRGNCLVTTNTSGIPIHALTEGRSESFRRHFLGAHFFNPPRHLKLLELIPTADTAPEVLRFLQQFGQRRLGKGVVVARDVSNFIANRIGIFALQHRMHAALQMGYTVEEVDALCGPLIGNPKTAVFRLADLIGLDVLRQVSENVLHHAPDDESREEFSTPAVVQTLIARGDLGNKRGAGFYRKTAQADGSSALEALDLRTLEYAPLRQPTFDVVQATQRLPLEERMRVIFDQWGDDRGGRFVVETTLHILAYAARRALEVAHALDDIDKAMRWGFNAEAGPFELWDMIGLARGCALMRARGIALPAWIDDMLRQGCPSFYLRERGEATHVYHPQSGGYRPLQPPRFHVSLARDAADPRLIYRNASASIQDIGDGVLNLAFHAKGNTLDEETHAAFQRALELLAREAWRGLVIANAGKDFCLGANIAQFLVEEREHLVRVERFIQQLQDDLMALRHADKPVVVAPHQRVLGGGAEVVLAGARVVAPAETYIGLVEVGVGVIPAGGGCKELLLRAVSPHLVHDKVDALSYVQRVFELIAQARVSESAFVARDLGFLDTCDVILMDADARVGVAKATVLHLSEIGYQPRDPNARAVYATGRRGKAALEMLIHTWRWGNYISDHDAHIFRKLAHVLCGGDLSLPQWVTAQYILDLEREAFCSLVAEPKTQARIRHMLSYAKPLKN